MNNKHRSGFIRRVIRFSLLLLWVAGLGLLAANRQNLADWWRLRNYQAPTTVAQLATQDTMTVYGRKIFYVNQPSLDSTATFNAACPNDATHEQTIVLGCYHGNQAGIFLLPVSDARLSGVEQVTAAHEMLHAAYDRLSRSDRQQVNTMLTAYYQTQHDPRIIKTIDAYKKSEPNDVVNEMHSVFGSEISQLPPGLEHYYQRYFTNRSQVAAFAAQYQAAFTSRQATLTRDDALLSSLKDQISNLERELKTKQADIASQQSALFTQKNSGNIAAYNAGVPGYNQLVDEYNAEVATVQNLVDRYNQLVVARNGVALEEDQLVKELSNTATPLEH